jgi:hypothetical protein
MVNYDGLFKKKTQQSRHSQPGRSWTSATLQAAPS